MCSRFTFLDNLFLRTTRKANFLFVSILCVATALHAESNIETMTITEKPELPVSHYTSPTTKITEQEVEGINASTVEDFIKYEPSLIVRRRYIGDSNGTLGIRGSNMFQTTRSMVFADGLPLHYLLQTRFSGSPRWSLVAPDETKSVEVVYGPFSAEYSGNAMGGVVNIETKMPTQREVHAELGYFNQEFDYLSTDEHYDGYRGFVSYGDKFGDLSVYLFHNRVENDSQPMTFQTGTVPVGSTGGRVGK